MELLDLTPEKIKEMDQQRLTELAAALRTQMIRTVSENGGHLASNLGVVELTLAIHRSFDSPRDKIVWDVGHQCYTHKLITGRGDRMNTLRRQDGLSGFPKPEESEHDAYVAGHSSSSISIAHGMAKASRLQGKDNFTVCVVGDGAIAGGMAFEALNNCARTDERLIIVLNDNEMSIGKSVGALARNLTRIRNGTTYFRFKDGIARFFESIPLVGMSIRRFFSAFKDRVRDLFLRDNIFQKMGLVYLGPIDGHNIAAVTRLFDRAKQLNKPVLIHVNTIKGKGYEFAENRPDRFHGLGQFDIATGACEENTCESYSVLMGKELAALAREDKTVCAVSAAMVKGTGLSNMPADRLFDVGMAEEHAVSFAGGLAAAGMKPVCAIYSCFLQRAYDQIHQDVCLANQHVILCIDRAGVVGEDGETHQGLFDVGFLTPMPNLTIYSPASGDQMKKVLRKALYDHNEPVAIRYPRGDAADLPGGEPYDGFTLFRRGGKSLVVTYGRETEEALRTSADVLSLCRIKPLPMEAVHIACAYEKILFAEEGMKRGGIGEQFAELLREKKFAGRYSICAVDDVFVKQATVGETISALKLDGASLEILLAKE